MTTEDTQFTVGKTTFYQGEHGTHPLFRIEAQVQLPTGPRTLH